MKTKSSVDKRLERDPRYAVAKARLTELNSQLATAEKVRAELLDTLGSLAAGRAADAIANEAQALLSGARAQEAVRREELTQTLGGVEHQIAVVRQAIAMQRDDIVAKLKSEVSRAICEDVKPHRHAILRKMAAAAMALAEICREERELREELIDNDVLFSATLRPMFIRGFDPRDNQSLLSRFLLELVENDVLSVGELPEKR